MNTETIYYLISLLILIFISGAYIQTLNKKIRLLKIENDKLKKEKLLRERRKSAFEAIFFGALESAAKKETEKGNETEH